MAPLYLSMKYSAMVLWCYAKRMSSILDSASISAHDTAHKYLTGVLNGRTSIPAKDWKAEREKLLSERYGLCDKYFSLKDDVRSIEKLKRGMVGFCSIQAIIFSCVSFIVTLKPTSFPTPFPTS